MNRRTVLTTGAAAMVGAVAFVSGVLFIAGGDDPATVSLDQAVAAASTAGNTALVASATGSSDDLAGTWTLVGGGSSFVGYRVAEELAGIGATTAVGRTNAVSGSLSYDGDQIHAVTVEADVSQLQSDQSRRDMALRQQALETGKYPDATFALTSPIPLDSAPAEGTTLTVQATGALTLHGVTKAIAIPVQGTFVDGRVVVVGTTEIVFADYGIAQPRAAAVLSVADRATLEMQLVFERQG